MHPFFLRRFFSSASSKPWSLLVSEPSVTDSVTRSTRCALTAARLLNPDNHIALLLLGCRPQKLRLRVNVGLRAEALNHGLAESTAKFIASVVANPQIASLDAPVTNIIGPMCSTTRDAFPRLGALLNVQPLTDITAIREGIFERPTYAGNAIASVKSADSVKIIAFRQAAFTPSEDEKGLDTEIREVEWDTPGVERSEFVEEIVEESSRPALESAKVVVSGGRGFRNRENFEELLGGLCSKLNAALGATRAAVDSGFAGNELQVGQTGKVVAPDVYFAIGISGAIQHIAGIQDSKVVVSINKDPDAPIFKCSDYFMQKDLFEAVPALTKALPDRN